LVPSKFVNLPGGSESTANTLRVQYAGHETRVTKAALWLTIPTPLDELQLLKTFADAATKLLQASSGIPLSQAMQDAIRAKKPCTEALDGYRISVEHILLGPKGPGYIMRFMVQSEAGGFPVDDPATVLNDRAKES
jgi:hypothetical protein